MSVFPFHQLRRSEVNYLITFAPIFFSHVLVPTLSYFAGTESSEVFSDLYSLFPGFTRQYVESLLLDPSRHELFKDSQWFTYLFVHGNYQHMLGNLYTAYVCGRPVFFEFGPVGLFFLFFSGGVVSCLPSQLSNDQTRILDSAIKDSFVIKNQPYVPGFLKSAWNTYVPPLGGKILRSQLPTRICGSSGAVCALLGASTMISFRDIFRSEEVRKFISNRFGYKWSSNLSRRHSVHGDDPDMSLLNHLYTFSTSVAYLFAEYHLIYGTAHSLPGGFLDRLAGILERAQVGHAAHLQGALYGAAFAAIFGILFPYVNRKTNGGNGSRPRVSII